MGIAGVLQKKICSLGWVTLSLGLIACGAVAPNTGPGPGPVQQAVGGPLEVPLPASEFDPFPISDFNFELEERKIINPPSNNATGLVALDPKTLIRGQVFRRVKRPDGKGFGQEPCCEGKWVSIQVISPFGSRRNCYFEQVGSEGHLSATVPASEFAELVLSLAKPDFTVPDNKFLPNCGGPTQIGSASPEGEILAILEGKPPPEPQGSTAAVPGEDGIVPTQGNFTILNSPFQSTTVQRQFQSLFGGTSDTQSNSKDGDDSE